jgi:hypothetical protein
VLENKLWYKSSVLTVGVMLPTFAGNVQFVQFPKEASYALIILRKFICADIYFIHRERYLWLKCCIC